MTRKFLVIPVILYLLLSVSLYAHDNDMIHPFTLSGKAWGLLRDKTIVNNKTPYEDLGNYFYLNNEIPSGYSRGDGSFDHTKIGKTGTLGTIEEDNGIRWLSHFYVPVTSDHKAWWNYPLFWTVDAVTYGTPFFQEAIKQYNNHNPLKAYEYFGRCVHLMQDMSVGGHVFGDAHGTEKEGYENWCIAEENKAALENVQAGTFPQNKDFEALSRELAERTFKVTRIEGHLDVATKTYDGDIADMFPQGHIQYLKYVRYNDEYGREVTHEWRIAGVGSNYTADKYLVNYQDDKVHYPDGTSEWWRCPNFPGETGEYYYIESRQMNVTPAKYRLHDEYGNRTALVDNPNGYSLCRFWAIDDRLISQTVESSAGLMKYFYDLVNEPPVVKQVQVYTGYGNKIVYDGYWTTVLKYDNDNLSSASTTFYVSPPSSIAYVGQSGSVVSQDGRKRFNGIQELYKEINNDSDYI